MKISRFIVILLLAAGIIKAQDKSTEIKTEDDKVSYSIGYNIGSNLKDPNIKINFDVLVKAMKDVLDGKQPAMTQEEMNQTMQAFNQKMMEAKNKQTSEMVAKNKKAGEEFLAANRKKPGVVALPDGLQYKVITEGSGPSPKDTDTVKVNYRGTLLDGREFDSSYSRNEPAVFPLNHVIKGWTEGLQLMKKGAKWEFYIPSELAYGERGAGQLIEPGSTLIFEVELLDINPKEK